MRISKLIICSLFSLCALAGCKKENLENTIVGKWNITKIEGLNEGRVVFSKSGLEAAEHIGYFSFTFTEYGGLITEDYGTGYKDDWTYIIKGDHLHTNMFDYPDEDYLTIKTLTRKELVLSFEEDSDEGFQEGRLSFKRADQ